MHARRLSLVMTLVLSSATHALDVPVGGKKIVLKRASSGAAKLTFLTRDAGVPFPAVGSADDPATGTPGGIVIEVFAAGGSQQAAFTVPSGEGRPGWSVRSGPPGAYVFANSAAPGGISVVRKVAMKQGIVLKIRSEEHTSELQSQSNLVCRLLL